MENMIPADEFCTHHNIEISFISSLHDSGLIDIIYIDENFFIHVNQLHELEKIVRLYYEMDINIEGIETITFLLQRMNTMQEEITALKNRIRIYEPNE